MVTLLIILGIILIVLGVFLIVYGVGEYEELFVALGVLLLIVGIVTPIVAIAGSEDSNNDKRVRYTYEKACYEIGGEYINLEGKNTCLVEE